MWDFRDMGVLFGGEGGKQARAKGIGSWFLMRNQAEYRDRRSRNEDRQVDDGGGFRTFGGCGPFCRFSR